jgi:Ca-activated chloride channel family protein
MSVGSLSGEGNYELQRSNETYQPIQGNKIKQVSKDSISTFSVDVDTGGYTNIRRILESGHLPERDQVRTEEFINYFDYEYPSPATQQEAFSITTDVTPSPWNSNSHLLHIGLKGFAEDPRDLPDSNIVFLVDISGSMDDENKLPLVKKSLMLLAKNLRSTDKISIVTYAGSTQVMLPPTYGSEKGIIQSAIQYLGAGGSTAGESGLKLAYAQAQIGFIPKGNNRIIMMTDGDFNVGLSSVEALNKMVKEKRKTGIYLSTIGFGMGNYRDDVLEQIADHGNGFYFYIDSYREALRVFQKNFRSNIFAIAKDVKIQVEFNPAQVSEYRLIGYENRILDRQDFSNDKVDAGEVGQGHTVTAIYELTLVGSPKKVARKRYSPSTTAKHQSNELAFVQLRYKPLDSHLSLLKQKSIGRKISQYPDISDDFKMVINAAGFAELLRDSVNISRDFSYDELLLLIRSDTRSQHRELVELETLVELAKSI